MRVPKMVKNGFNSGLPVSPVLEEDKMPNEIKNRHGAQGRPSGHGGRIKTILGQFRNKHAR
jgi:hypothetical protein